MAGDERAGDLARIWAVALLRVAEEKGVSDAVLGEIEEIARYGEENPGFARVFLSSIGAADQRRAAFERILRGRVSEVFADFVQVLDRKGRSGLLPAVARAYRAALQAARGIVDVEVVSVAPLGGAERERVAAAVRRRTGLEARLIERIDPSLLGGLVVRVRDSKFDSSLRTRLERMRHALLERATREIIQDRTQPSEEKR